MNHLAHYTKITLNVAVIFLSLTSLGLARKPDSEIRTYNNSLFTAIMAGDTTKINSTLTERATQGITQETTLNEDAFLVQRTWDEPTPTGNIIRMGEGFTQHGQRATWFAAARGHVLTFKTLLEQGARFFISVPAESFQSISGTVDNIPLAYSSPLCLAVILGNVSMVQYILETFRDVLTANPFELNNALINAVIYEQPEALRLLIAAGADVNHTPPSGFTHPPLYTATLSLDANLAIAQILLENGATTVVNFPILDNGRYDAMGQLVGATEEPRRPLDVLAELRNAIATKSYNRERVRFLTTMLAMFERVLAQRTTASEFSHNNVTETVSSSSSNAPSVQNPNIIPSIYGASSGHMSM